MPPGARPRFSGPRSAGTSGPFPAAPDHPHLGAAVGHLGWQSHSPVPGGQSFSGQPSWAGVHLEQLPAYAPELNPDEGVWNYLKRVELKNVIGLTQLRVILNRNPVVLSLVYRIQMRNSYVICQHLGQLSYELGKAIKRLRQKPHIIRACIAQAGLV